jgi:hypothetical protein
MEALIAIILVCLVAAGLAVGLIAGRRPLARSCDGLACVGGQRCAACPGRKEDAA